VNRDDWFRVLAAEAGEVSSGEYGSSTRSTQAYSPRERWTLTVVHRAAAYRQDPGRRGFTAAIHNDAFRTRRCQKHAPVRRDTQNGGGWIHVLVRDLKELVRATADAQLARLEYGAGRLLVCR